MPHGSELKQVRTNIIGNAIGAIGGLGAPAAGFGRMRSRHRLIPPDCRAPLVPNPASLRGTGRAQVAEVEHVCVIECMLSEARKYG